MKKYCIKVGDSCYVYDYSLSRGLELTQNIEEAHAWDSVQSASEFQANFLYTTVLEF